MKKKALFDALYAAKIPFTPDAPLAPLLSMKTGGPAFALLHVDDVDPLIEARRIATEIGVEILVIGGGANLLVRDGGFPGIAIVLGKNFARLDRIPGSEPEAWYA